jgi:carbon storage regulator
MLVFTRKRGEAIVIGDNIEVVVLSAGKEGLRVGVRAPQSIPVHRKEIYELIREENRTAALGLGGAAQSPVPADTSAGGRR